MGRFFELNWVVLVVTALIMIGGYYLENKYKFLSEKIKVEPKTFYVIVGMLAVIIALVNYIAIVVFKSWNTMFITAGVGIILFFVIMHFLKKNKDK